MSENAATTQGEGGGLSPSDVEEILARHWDVRSRVLPLGSLQDSVYRVVDERNEPVGAVRVSTSTVDDGEVEGEARCLAHLASALPEFDLPVLQAGLDGTVLHRQEDSSIRLMRWVRGAPLAAWSRMPDQAARELGTVAGHVTEALRDFDDASLQRYREWDPRHAVSVSERYTSRCPESLRALMDVALPRTRAALSHPSVDVLPWQVVHMDLTDLNVLGVFGSRGTFTATSIVDFEDMVWSWRLCELAVTAHAVIGRRPEDPVGALAHVLAGFLEHAVLSEPEADLLWAVVVARALACAVVEAVEAVDQLDNDYATRLAALDITALRSVLDVDETYARAFVRRACGFRPAHVDLEIPDKDHITTLVPDGGPAGYQTSLDLTDSERDQAVPDVMALGTVVRMPGPCDVVVPSECEVDNVSDGSVTLRLHTTAGPGAYLRIEGLATDAVAGTTLAQGEPLGRVASSDGASFDLHVQLIGDPATPSTGKVRDADLWRQLCPDPHDFLPATAHGPPPATRAEEAMTRRTRHVAQVQRTYFHAPPHIVVGRGQWLYDSTGRRYLDMVNNVAVAGHSHPRITAAAAAQLALLSTNSRFLYDAIADYAAKIVATLPPELDTVLLVNSGSEAVELALQLARAHTGRHDVIVMDGVYHGWTTELLELGTIEADRPNWRERLAPWVHVADAPDPYRGAHGDALEAYVRSVVVQCEAASVNGGPAAFLNEPVLGNRGGVVPPPGYQQAAYDVVRRAGGLCIADEVQVGYGRTGASFWTFESQGAAPDILASAKAAGNGHPVGFVACRREIAESFVGASVFFSTAGGNPVSCKVGEAVLDIIREEGLQENARQVGERIAAGLTDLKTRHAVIGATTASVFTREST